MKRWRSFLICFLLLAGCGRAEDTGEGKEAPKVPIEAPAFPDAGAYVASAMQERVDRSFSDISIGAPFEAVQARLTEIQIDGCENSDECAWRDPAGVQHYFWGDSPSDLTVVTKIVQADEFEGRPIDALGIGMERGREAVLAKIRQFLPGIELDCDPANVSENVGSDACAAFVDPGWFEVGFDRDGQLETIRFDGYHYT